MGAGQDPYRHGPPADPGVDGAAPALPGGHRPPPGGGRGAGGRRHRPGGADPHPAGNHRSGAADRPHRLRHRRRAGSGGPGKRPGQAARPAGAAGRLLLRPAGLPAGGAGRSHRAAGAHRPGYRGRAPLLRPGGRLHPGGLPPGGGPPAGHYGQRKGPGGLHRGQGEGEDRHQEPEGGLQQGLRLLHRGVQVLLRPGARHLHPQADPHQLRAVHHPGAQGAGARDPLRPGPHHRPGV